MSERKLNKDQSACYGSIGKDPMCISCLRNDPQDGHVLFQMFGAMMKDKLITKCTGYINKDKK